MDGDQRDVLSRMVTEDETEYEKALRYSEEGCQSLFDYAVRKPSRNHHFPREMKRADTSGSFMYAADSEYSFLYDMQMYLKLPKVVVKKEYRNNVQIAMCSYPGINVVTQATMYCGKKKSPYHFDQTWFNIYNQFYNKKTEHFNRYCGHIPALTDWGHSLPSHQLQVQQPWFFTREGFPFPLFRVKESVQFEYTFKKSIFDLLRFKIRAEGEDWEEVPFHNNFIQFVSVTNGGILSPPIMIGEYSKITIEEEQAIKNNDKHCAVEDILTFKTELVDKITPLAQVQIKTKYPLKGIFYVAENVDATRLNNFSNFSTCSEDMSEGVSPICSVEPKINGSTPLIPFSSEFTGEVLAAYYQSNSALRYFPSFPQDPGYAAIPIAYSMADPAHDGFKSFQGDTSITFQLSDAVENPEEEEDKGKEPNFSKFTELLKDKSSIGGKVKSLRHNFRIHVYVIYIKRLTYGDDGELKVNDFSDIPKKAD